MKHTLTSLGLTMTGLCLSFGLVSAPALASDIITISTDKTFEIVTYDLKEPTKLLLLAPSKLDSFKLETETLTLGLKAGQPVTLASMQELNIEAFEQSSGMLNLKSTCNSGVSSMLSLLPDQDMEVQIRVAQTPCKNIDLSRQSEIVVPEITSVVINSGDECTAESEVEVSVTSKNAEKILLSNNPSLEAADWDKAFQINGDKLSTTWTLKFETDGQKTVYALARSKTGGLSVVASDSIQLSAAAECATTEKIVDLILDDKMMNRENIYISKNNTIYHRTEDSKFYLFVDEAALESWHKVPMFRTKEDEAKSSSTTLFGVVGYHPGAVLIVMPESPKVYAVAPHGSLRWINTEAVAEELYETRWKALLSEMAPENLKFFTIGDPIAKAEDYNLAELLNASIEDELLEVK